jgi:hypothetical protein
MLTVTAEGFLLTLYAGIPLTLWLAAWAVTGRGSEEYREAFLHLYHAEIGTMVVEGAPIDAVVPVEGYETWWTGIVLWLLDTASTCTGGCTQSQRPVM